MPSARARRAAAAFLASDPAGLCVWRGQEDAAVYKLVGPVLIPQDLIEAKANVAKRLEYMQGET